MYPRDQKPVHPLAHLAFPFSKAVEYQSNIFRAAQDLEAFFKKICEIDEKREDALGVEFEPKETHGLTYNPSFYLKWPCDKSHAYKAYVTIYGFGRLTARFSGQHNLGYTAVMAEEFHYDLDPKEPHAHLTAQMINIVASAYSDIQELIRRNQQAFLDEIDSKMIVQPLGDPKPSIA
ncbi:MAG: hypothetical protein J0L77_00760 [Alphaproteobacteria bacterium]|nr:hypothetical protein [Alphaproteobacteria bacterium]